MCFQLGPWRKRLRVIRAGSAIGPVFIHPHALKQNTGNLSGSGALSVRQRRLPKYLHLLLLFIYQPCRSFYLLLVFGEYPPSKNPPHPSRKVETRFFFSLSFFSFTLDTFSDSTVSYLENGATSSLPLHDIYSLSDSRTSRSRR